MIFIILRLIFVFLHSEMERILGTYGQDKGKVLFIVLAGIHGNEHAGVKALMELFEFLETAKVSFDGRIVGLAGNIAALEKKTRFIHKDLNRQWYPTKVKKLNALPFGMLNTKEDFEQKDLLNGIEEELKNAENYKQVFVIDLHTTSARGGCFSISNEHSNSHFFATMMPVPVISGMTEVLKGTTLEYFESLNIPAIAFEAGQHDEEASVPRMKAALICLAYKSDCITEEIYNLFDKEVDDLWRYNKGLPHIVKVVYRHEIDEEDEFIMRPNYRNFMDVEEGEILALDIKGPIKSPLSGKILMPLYQKKGDDGFFIVEKLQFEN